MKILCNCIQCTVWSNEKTVKHISGNGKVGWSAPGRNDRKIALALNEEGALRIICEKGHESTLYIKNRKYSILCAIGADAILDGYYREAISSFASAIESFYDYYLQVIVEKLNIEDSQAKLAWKKIKLSERRLGAFVFAYLAQNMRVPMMLSDKNIELRNKVIHNGQIPDRTDCIQFGQGILDIINPILAEMEKDLNHPAFIVDCKSNSSRTWQSVMSKQALEGPIYGKHAWIQIPSPLTEHVALSQHIKSEQPNFKTLDAYLLAYASNKRLVDIYPLNQWALFSAEITLKVINFPNSSKQDWV